MIVVARAERGAERIDGGWPTASLGFPTLFSPGGAVDLGGLAGGKGGGEG